MSHQTNLSGATVVVYPLLTTITDHEIEDALAPAVFGAGTFKVQLGERPLQLSELADLDWGAAHDGLTREIDARLIPAVKSGGGPVYYFGMPPIPLAIELGSRLGPAQRVLAYQQRHDSKSWRWPSDQPTVGAQLLGVPDVACQAKGDVIMRVTCSHPVTTDDAREVVPFAIGELHVEVANHHEDVLQSEADVTLVASKFGEALDRVRHLYPNCDTVHVFAAVPPALAVRLGTEINPTIHRPLQTYQFSGRGKPRYTRALRVGERSLPDLSPAEREDAARARGAFARALEQIHALADLELPPDRWLEDLVGPAASVLRGPLRKLGPLGKNKAIVGARVDLDLHEAGGEFRFNAAARTWVFDDRLLAALAKRLNADEIEQAGRLFLLHEGIHIARQGLTTANAERVGRLPRVLEDADYLADVWALLNEYGRAVRAGEVDEVGAADFFRRVLTIMTATFWAFDAGGLPLRDVPVRRLNRYLIWYWQRLALERADTLEDVLASLATKPILEISGPRVSTSRSRVMFDLDPAYIEIVEFGALVGGFRVVRIGARPGAQVGTLLEALRLGDEQKFLDLLRGIFDSIDSED